MLAPMGRTNKVSWRARRARASRRLRRLHRPLDPRAARDACQPRALVRRVAVDFTAEAVFEVEGVEVEEQASGHTAVTLIHVSIGRPRWWSTRSASLQPARRPPSSRAGQLTRRAGRLSL